MQPGGLAASITPATLTYVATPAMIGVGQPIQALSGTVTGFLGADTLADATSGSLFFTTTASSSSPAGVYGVAGSGLTALNYSFVQAPTNASALSIVASGPAIAASSDVVNASVNAVNTALASDSPDKSGGKAATTVAITAVLSRAAESGVENLVVPVSTNSVDAPLVGDFGPIAVGSLSTSELQSLLAGRERFKQVLLADAVQKLADNGSLPDLADCQTVEEAEAGRCLVTQALRARVKSTPAAPAAKAPPAAPAPDAPGSVKTVPSAPDAAKAAPSSPVDVASPTSADADTNALLLRQVQRIRRRVLSAALPEIERKIAVVIGVDRYADKSIPSLDNAVRDADAVPKVFETRLGYEAVVLRNATRRAVVAALNELALALGPRDSVVIYYAGHGELVEATKLGYWLLADGQAKDPQTWLSNTDIGRLIGQIGASQVALISDSCYSGSLTSEERIRAAATPLDPKAVLANKSVVVMSSGGNEPVFDSGRDGHSPFAWNLMNMLGNVSGWQAGGNVFERVRFAVARELPQRPQYSAARAAGHQPGGDYLFEKRELGATPQ